MTCISAASVLQVRVATTLRRRKSGAGETGFGKTCFDDSIRLLVSGLEGDLIGDRRRHGGLDRAVLAYAIEDYDEWGAALGRPLPPGSFGENLTVQGVRMEDVYVGDIWQIGPAAQVQAVQPRFPCATLKEEVGEELWGWRFTAARRCGIFFRVVAEGMIGHGDVITLIRRSPARIPVSECGVDGSPETFARLLGSSEHVSDAVAAVARGVIEQGVPRQPRASIQARLDALPRPRRSGAPPGLYQDGSLFDVFSDTDRSG